MDVIIIELEAQKSSKIDASLGLLNNVPSSVLNRLNNKFGLDSDTNSIEVTILYRDEPNEVKNVVEGLGGRFQDLDFNFAIVTIPVDRIVDLARSNSIQYIELPKNLYTSDARNNRESCIPQAVSTYNVTGKGILVGFIDSGIDYTHPAFMNNEGTTRIEYIYDLSNGGNVYNKENINDAIKASDPYSVVPSTDITGHGTHVAGIACGGGNIPNSYKGVATEASIAMVKGTRGYWVLSTQIMQGLKFLLDKSRELNMPLVVNISLSTNNGAHNGSSLLEQYIRTVSNLERITVVIAAGNEGDSAHHTGGMFEETQNQSFSIASDENIVVLNLYKSILPDIIINIKGPTGESSGDISIREGYFQGSIGRDRYDFYVAGPKPFELNNEIQIVISPISSNYITGGSWTILIDKVNNYKGEYSIWLPVSEGLNQKTRFLTPIVFNTLGIPATVDNIIAVGSYNPISRTLSTFSGRGAQERRQALRPDVVAPGENVMGPIPEGGYDSKTGTSMATPQVSGICALLMEWGIVKGNDFYLYSQRLKYYLVKGSNRKRTDVTYPNPSWGYGTVCAYDSFDLIESTINSILAGRQNKFISDNYREIKNLHLNSRNIIDNLSEICGGNALNSSPNDLVSLIIQVPNADVVNQIKKDIPDIITFMVSEAFFIVFIPYKDINKLSNYNIDIPPNINPSVYTLTELTPVEASGAALFTNNPYLRLDGTGVLVGIIDTGIDYMNEEFMLEDDTTRIVSIWDQTIQGTEEVQGIKLGTEYNENQINEAIKLSKSGGDPYSIVASKDEVGHGTMTAGIIGGRGRNPDLLGAAPNCKFAVVKLRELSKTEQEFSGVSKDGVNKYGYIDIILALIYLGNIALQLDMPIVFHIPLGSNTGAHDGNSYIERYFESISGRRGFIPVVGTGNQGDTQTHTEGKINNTGDMVTVEVKVGKNQKDMNFQFYFLKPDKVSIGMVTPSGEVLERIDTNLKSVKNYKFIYEGTTVCINYLLPDIISGNEVIIVKLRDLKEGTWVFRLYGDYIVDGRYWSWLPQRELLDNDTRFLSPVQTSTLTVPSTGKNLIAAGYYNQEQNTIMVESGRGYTIDGRVKPDIAAGGFNAIVIKPGGDTSVATGSSVGSSVLAGCCALILQWAVINKNDIDINVNKMIAYIIRGAKAREGDIYPNKEWGFGMLDVDGIFNSLRSKSDKKCNDMYVDDEIKYVNYAELNKLRNENEIIEFYIGNLYCRIF
ncbi:MAG: peptidase S8 [Clostridium butyricum]|nr:peptidase S8 [Clostridium butyricum]